MTHTCNICHKTFGMKSDLNRHVKSVHDKIKDFNCDQCDKAFGQNGNLNRHIMIVHSKIKAFKCNYLTSLLG